MRIAALSRTAGWMFTAVVFALPQLAAAQQEQQAEDDDAPQFTDEVTVRVTARKREENLQSVPFSMVAPT